MTPRPCCAATLAALTNTALSARCKCGRVVQIATGKQDMRRDVSKATRLVR